MSVKVMVTNNTEEPISVYFMNGPTGGDMDIKNIPPGGGTKNGNFDKENARVVCAWKDDDHFGTEPAAAGFMQPPYNPDHTYSVVVNNGSIDIN